MPPFPPSTAAKKNEGVIMSPPDDGASGARAVLDRDEIEEVLSGSYYTPAPQPERRAKTLGGAGEKPAHYKVICISMYTSDLEQLDAMVEKLKGRGLTKANRSALIRFALAQVDIEKVPRGL
jgi:hypothetical protein